MRDGSRPRPSRPGRPGLGGLTLVVAILLLGSCVVLGVFSLRSLAREDRLSRGEREETRRLRAQRASRLVERTVEKAVDTLLGLPRSGSGELQARTLQGGLPSSPLVWHAVFLMPDGELRWPSLPWEDADDARALRAASELECAAFLQAVRSWRVGHAARLAAALAMGRRRPGCDLFEWVRVPLLADLHLRARSDRVWRLAATPTGGLWVVRHPEHFLVLRSSEEGWVGFAVRLRAELAKELGQALPSAIGSVWIDGSHPGAGDDDPRLVASSLGGVLGGLRLWTRQAAPPGSSTWIVVTAISVSLLLAGFAAFLILRSLRRQTELAARRAHLFSLLGHELKTPVAAQLSLLETLGRKDLPPEQRGRYLAALRTEGQRLLRMTENFLEMERPEAGTRVASRCDVTVLGHQLLEELAAQAEARSVALQFEERHPAWIQVDVRALELALRNLLDNAVKYVPEGGWVRLELERAPRKVVLRVLDSGPGVPPDLGDTVFEPFVRGDRRDVPGSGLGLHLARSIIEREGGTLALLPSAEGVRGFRVTLPRSQP